jgi:hypothetical protein
MNHFKMTLAITAIVAAAALATVAFAVPQQVMAGGYKHNYHKINHNGIKVDQQVNQENQCSGQLLGRTMDAVMRVAPSTLCINLGSNDATIHR